MGTGMGAADGRADGTVGAGTGVVRLPAAAAPTPATVGTGIETLGAASDCGAATARYGVGGGGDACAVVTAAADGTGTGGAGMLKPPPRLAFFAGDGCGTGGLGYDGTAVVLRGLRGATASGVGATTEVVCDSAPAGVGTAIVSDGCSSLRRPTWNCDCAKEAGTGMFSGVPSLVPSLELVPRSKELTERRELSGGAAGFGGTVGTAGGGGGGT